MPDEFPRGRFIWHELLAVDPAAAVLFYPKVIGWGTLPFEHDPSYEMWTAGGNPLGGTLVIPDDAQAAGASPSWLPYVAVPDIDAAVRQATALGATVYVAPRTLPHVGRFAVLLDPQGATFALYHPEGVPPGHDGASQLGEFSWHELVTTDWRAAWSFYQTLFGWVQTGAMDLGADSVYQMFGRDGRAMGAVFTRPAGSTSSPHWLSYVRVPDADQAVRAVLECGGRVQSGPMDAPGGDRVATCVDSQGAAFAIHAVGSSARTPASNTKRSATGAGAARGPARRRR